MSMVPSFPGPHNNLDPFLNNNHKACESAQCVTKFLFCFLTTHRCHQQSVKVKSKKESDYKQTEVSLESGVSEQIRVRLGCHV